jgi:hypothetical protein
MNTFEAIHPNRIKEFSLKKIETLMPKMGFVEILPEEKAIAKDIRWCGYLGRSLFRLGDRGRFLYDSDNSLSSYLHGVQEKSNFLTAVKQSLHGNTDGLKNVFTDSDDLIMAKGTLRRMTNSKKLRTLIEKAISKDSFKINQLYAIIRREMELVRQEEVDTNLPNVLIVAHERIAQISATFDGGNELGDNDSTQHKLMFPTFIQREIMASTMPHLAVSILVQELKRSGMVGRVKVVDYKDIIDGSFKTRVGSFNFNQAMLVGATTLDAKEVIKVANTLENDGKNVLIGGLGVDLDPNVYANTTKADLYSGEAEGIGKKLMIALKEKGPNQRLMLHRGKTPIRPLDSGITLSPVFSEKFLGESQYVDMYRHYSFDKESNGQLAERLRFHNKSIPFGHFFGKEWDSPASLKLAQLDAVRGCAWGCPMCSTVDQLGHTMRRKPADSLALAITAMEEWGIALTDQNIGGIGRNETIEQWTGWMYKFFENAVENKKRLFIMTELPFFQRINELPNLKKLVDKSLFLYLFGMEHPRNVVGNAVKNPDMQVDQIMIAKKFNAISIATEVTGLEPDINDTEWFMMNHNANPDIIIDFPRMYMPGAGGPQTRADTTSPLKNYDALSVVHREDKAQALRILREFYQTKKILSRFINLKGNALSKFIFIFNNIFFKVALDQFEDGYFAITNLSAVGKNMNVK